MAQDSKQQSSHVIAAMIKIQSELRPLIRNREGHHGAYADLEAVFEMLQPLLEKNDLAVIQVPASGSSGGCSIETRIVHVSGDTLSGVITIPTSRQNDPQSFGAAMTYARRYSLMAMFGMVTEDDDADGATLTLEKLLKEMCSKTSSSELYQTREHHQQYLSHSRFWQSIYELVFEKRLERILKLEKNEKAQTKEGEE